MTTSLLATRRFAPLFWCQFFSAFGDNFLRTALVFLILFKVGGSGSEVLISLASATVIAPYFFLSGLGGQMADRFDKAIVARRLKLSEIFAASIAVAGFALHSLPILFFALFCYGVIAALFGPIKYGILPDHLKQSELPRGNALIESATFIAILLGTIVGGIAAKNGGSFASFAALMIAFSSFSFITSLFILPTGEGAPHLSVQANIAASTVSLIRQLHSNRLLWWGGLVSSWFWLMGIVVLSIMPPLVKNVLGADEQTVTVFLAVFSISIAVGSGLAAWLAAGRIILLPTLAACVLIGVLAVYLGLITYGSVPGATPRSFTDILASAHGIHVLIAFAGLAISGGLFIVPCFAAIQAWAGPDQRARVIAAVNIINAAFMTFGALIIAVLQTAGVRTPGIFIVIGVASLLVAFLIARTMPTNVLGDTLSILYRVLFRIEVSGIDNLAKAGPRVIIALNHVSFLDWGIALALYRQKALFAVDSNIAQRWWVRPFMGLGRTIAIDPLKPMGTRALINAVKDGYALAIFPEGRITVTGTLMKVYDGVAMIAEKSDAMVVPVRIEGLEQTPFSRLSKEQMPRRWFPKVKVTILEPVKLAVDPALKGRARRRAAGAKLYEVMSNLIFRTTSTDRTIVEAVIQEAKRQGPGRIAIEDPLSGALSYRRILMGAAILGGKLMPLADEGRPLGVMLPNANGAVVTFLAVLSAGRVPAMINFSAGPKNIVAACKAAELSTVVTSRSFVEKGRLEPVVAAIAEHAHVVYLEDIRDTISTLDKIRGLFHRNKPLVPRKADDWAAILFTSGSEGMPKGVVLSHRNMLSNAAQAAARVDIGRTDILFNVLPMFHSFGLTVGTVLPLVLGVRIFLYPSPLHYRTIPELIYSTGATLLFGTDTFLAGYARSANAYDFRSIRYVLAGAEPVKEATRNAYLEKFGLRILEGYGVTETAPALALNTPMFNKFGTVGRLLPGMEARLEKVDGVEEGGRLFVSGPNVMLGYLRVEHPGVLEAPPEGWHDTGDIVTIDSEGYITIKGRAKRFAKIGGEMVSLAAVEMLASDIWPNAPSACATVPDARKGERLVLVTQQPDATRAALMAHAREKGASELMVPAEVVIVDKLPLLGAGKIDNLAVTAMVRDMMAARTETVRAHG